MALIAVAVEVTFSAPAFAGEEKQKDEKKGSRADTFGDKKEEQKDEQKPK